jgi:hypothetical protein
MLIAYFDYSCWESDDSADAELWHRTKQFVEVLRTVVYPEVDEDAVGGPMFEIRFRDGFEGLAWNDEIDFVGKPELAVPMLSGSERRSRGAKPCG